MDKIVSHEQLLGFIHEIRALRQGFVTNFYWDEMKHPYWIGCGDLLYERFKDCALLIRKNAGFYNLFYLATNLETAAKYVKELSLDKDCVVDMVFKGENIGGELFERAGFKPYSHLYRMSHFGQLATSDWQVDPCVKVANEEDIVSVFNALNEYFDPLCEQLPSFQELKDFAARQELLMAKSDGNNSSFLIFQIFGNTTWYWRYWFTWPEYRNSGVGSKLLKSALAMCKDTIRQQLWVKADNENAIKRHEHYGFKREMMNDYVMIKTKK